MKYRIGWQSKRIGTYHGVYLLYLYNRLEDANSMVIELNQRWPGIEHWVQTEYAILEEDN